MSHLSPKDQQTLDNLYLYLEERTQNFLGYPVSKDFDFSELSRFLAFPINNLGDPFVDSTYAVDTREMEKEVIHFLGDLFRADPNNIWGYVTNGGSEGNLYALYLARELYPKAMVYYSASTHYSVQKNMHLLNMNHIAISTDEKGEIDYADLESTLRMNRHLPAIILANIGTTMTEARDDVKKIRTILKKLALKDAYIHADGALSGSYSAFIENKPNFDFEDGADSIAISGHKFWGSPMPCGAIIVKKTNRDRIARSVEYIGSVDTTITGSRNGLGPLFLWYTIKKFGIEGLKKRAAHSLSVAAYALEQLKSIGIDAWRNENAITVVFAVPSKEIVTKYQLACEDGYTHVICMPNVTYEQIDQLINDIKASK